MNGWACGFFFCLDYEGFEMVLDMCLLKKLGRELKVMANNEPCRTMLGQTFLKPNHPI
jgi:hypothetical protein